MTDLAPVRGLERMIDLNITFNSISDVSPIAGMTELTTSASTTIRSPTSERCGG